MPGDRLTRDKNLNIKEKVEKKNTYTYKYLVFHHPTFLQVFLLQKREKYSCINQLDHKNKQHLLLVVSVIFPAVDFLTLVLFFLKPFLLGDRLTINKNLKY